MVKLTNTKFYDISLCNSRFSTCRKTDRHFDANRVTSCNFTLETTPRKPKIYGVKVKGSKQSLRELG